MISVFGRFGVCILTSLLSVIAVVVLKLIDSVQHEPYMDEVFHIPQARQYCQYNFTHWDPMITTLPGLYIAAFVILVPFSWIQHTELLDVCSSENLRACNIVFLIGNCLLLHHLTKANQDPQGPVCGGRRLLHAAVLASFPVLYFLSWMYYTDPGSTFFTLLMYALTVRKSHAPAALAGALAVVFRQTNVVWVIFCVGLNVIDAIEVHMKSRKYIRGSSLKNLDDAEALKLIVKSVFESLSSFTSLIKDVVANIFWYICILVLFVVFVYVNNGIVVGDRTNHQAVLNFPQVFYFTAISAVFSFPHMISPTKLKRFLFTLLQKPVLWITICIVMVYLIGNFTYEHKYTLSDNRHYTFYIWSKIYRRHEFVKYALIPGYLYCFYQFNHLTIHKGIMWRAAMILCTIAVLIPQALFEFRYYIIPFYILRLNMKLPCSKLLFIELLFYAFINAFTVYMFVMKPFTWPNEEGHQRFMW